MTSDAAGAPCSICGAADFRRLYRLTDFSILRCTECDQVYLRPLPTPEAIREMFTQLYTSGEGSVPELESYYDFCYEDAPENPLVQLYESWLDALERHRPPGRILDVGCGTGLFLSVARRRGWDPLGIDDCAEAISHARDHFGLDVRSGEFADFAAEGRRFDAITGWDVIEHAREPVALLETMRSCLEPDGIVGLSTPNQRSILDLVAGIAHRLTGGRLRWPLEKFYIEQHFLYFTPESLDRSLARAGLRTVEMQRELTDLRRLTLSPGMRLVLRGLFLAARGLGRENRIFAVARPGDAAS